MVEITINLPDMLAHAFGAAPEARAQRLTEDAAIEEYRTGRLSQRQVGEMLGLDYWQTERFLTERKVPLNYSLGDLQADSATLNEVLGRPGMRDRLSAYMGRPMEPPPGPTRDELLALLGTTGRMPVAAG